MSSLISEKIRIKCCRFCSEKSGRRVGEAGEIVVVRDRGHENRGGAMPVSGLGTKPRRNALFCSLPCLNPSPEGGAGPGACGVQSGPG